MPPRSATGRMNDPTITSRLKHEAKRLGFELSGVCPATTPPQIDRFRQWLASEYAGCMNYISDRAEAYEHPRHVLEGVRSILMLGLNYQTSERLEPDLMHGNISRYAWGTGDYHDVIHGKLKRLGRILHESVSNCKVRGVVDTAPILERDFAVMAGLGWMGKNTLLLNPRLGSWFFLAALLTDVELEYDKPFMTDHCGTCRACLDACPTNAFPQPYVLDATRCISYLTIELRDPIPTELRPEVGQWLFGCDVCQDVCPWNSRAPTSSEDAFAAASELNPANLIALFELDDDEFRKRFRRTPLWRSKRPGLLRNAAIVLGNQGCVTAEPALTKGLHDKEPLVRSACVWALARLKLATVPDKLRGRLAIEDDAETRREITMALNRIGQE